MDKYPSHILVTGPGYDLVITSVMHVMTNHIDKDFSAIFSLFTTFGEFCTPRLPCWHSIMLHMSLVLPSMPLRVLLSISH